LLHFWRTKEKAKILQSGQVALFFAYEANFVPRALPFLRKKPWERGCSKAEYLIHYSSDLNAIEVTSSLSFLKENPG